MPSPLRVRQASKYNNTKRKLKGVVRLPLDWVGHNVVVLKLAEHSQLIKTIGHLERKLKRCKSALNGGR
jgi:hypothetical protein